MTLRTLPQELQRFVGRQSVQPSRERRSAVEFIESLKQGKEHLLSQIFCVGFSNHSKHQSIHFLTVLKVQLLLSLTTTVQARFQQFAFVRRQAAEFGMDCWLCWSRYVFSGFQDEYPAGSQTGLKSRFVLEDTLQQIYRCGVYQRRSSNAEKISCLVMLTNLSANLLN